jgi:hypothetical protein
MRSIEKPIPDEATAKQIAEFSQVVEQLSTAAQQFNQANRPDESRACAEEAQRVLADIRRLRGESGPPEFPWAFWLPFTATPLGLLASYLGAPLNESALSRDRETGYQRSPDGISLQRPAAFSPGQ